MSDKRRVLFVDDDERFAGLVKRAMIREGWAAVTASSSAEAQDLVRRQSFHLALVDIMLKNSAFEGQDRSGFEIIEHVRALGEGTKVVAISSYALAAVPVQAIRMRVDDYIPKLEIGGAEDYLSILRPHVNAAKIHPFGHHDSIFSFLASPEDRGEWEGRCIVGLSITNDQFAHCIEKNLTPYLPLLPARIRSDAFDLDLPNKRILIRAWSKMTGKPHEFQFERSGAGLMFAVRNLDEKREQFAERTLDVVKAKTSRR